ncbi:MAG: succinylglutamate desuccinylase/aspartoacylase family protein [Campylobacterales bacterium]|nr:succinylglutamate desuccinylase/aspartoacylase family protein [Campylobacterales bacterium]
MQYIFLVTTFFISLLNANIQLIKKESSDSNTTLLVIAGIHGNEPGGYFAASVLATHYNITSKNLWIVPNLNKESIKRNERGIYGDMNRKFSYIDNNDHDKKIVEGIKSIILEDKVSLVLNLHDGHGFYRKENQGTVFNPTAWGQTCVIDQCKLKQEQAFGNLNEIALNVKNNINKKLLKQHHSFDVKNTNTKYEDETMQLSLTYFAVTNNKPAFAVETSKDLSSLSQKVFYQLLAIEEFMKIMKIHFTRSFNLNEKEIAKIIKNYGKLSINDNISLNLSNIKKSLSFIPIKSTGNRFDFSHPLGDIRKVKDNFLVYIGNEKVTTLKPQYFKLSQSCHLDRIFEVDGKVIDVPKTSEIYVNDDFKVITSKNNRVNIIGYHKAGYKNESGLKVSLKDLDKKFAIDKDNKIFRVEFYNNDEFCSMLLVHFK